MSKKIKKFRESQLSRTYRYSWSPPFPDPWLPLNFNSAGWAELVPTKWVSKVISSGNSNRKQFNDCLHTVIEGSLLPPFLHFEGSVGHDLSYYPGTGYPFLWKGPGGFLVPYLRGQKLVFGEVFPFDPDEPHESYVPFPEPLPSSLDDIDTEFLLASAFHAIVPKIETQISTLQFIAELRDLKSLVETPLNIFRKLKNLPKGTFTFRDLLKSVSQQHLSNSFGFIPTVADLTGLFDVFYATTTRFHDLWHNQGKVLTSHWTPGEEQDSSNLSIEDDWVTPGLAAGPWVGSPTWRVSGSHVSSCERKFTVTVKYQYTITDAFGNYIEKDLALVGAYFDALGLQLNPAILWDLVPFSFVVDWFVNVGDMLENLGKRNLEPSVTVLDCCYSVKEKTQTLYTFESRQVFGGIEEDAGSLAFRTRKTVYRRQRFCPRASWIHGDIPFEARLPSLRRWLLGGSLLLANL